MEFANYGGGAGGGGGGGSALANPLDRDLLYTPDFDNILKDFYIATNNELSIGALATHLTRLSASVILNILLKDPTQEHAIQCLSAQVNRSAILPQDFVARFLSVANLRITVIPTSSGLLTQSYNARVIANNLQPTTKITQLTMKTRQQQLRSQSTAVLCQTKRSEIPQTKRLHFTPDLMQKCINAMGDLHATIMEGNRANGREMDPYIQTSLASSGAPPAL